MSHFPKKLTHTQKEAEHETLNTSMVDEFPALSEKFFTFTHEMIALLWMKETTQTPIRGKRSHRK
jgi:hypothetical protein